MAPGGEKERAPSPGGVGRGSPAPAGKEDPSPTPGIRPSQRKVPRRRKAPDFSNSDVQRATLAIHSLGLVCVFVCFFLFFCNYFFFLFVLFLFFGFCPVGSYGDAAAAARPGAVEGKEPQVLSPSLAPRQRRSPARTCPEVSGAGNDAGFVPLERQNRSRRSREEGQPSRCCEKRGSSSCKIGGF